MADASPAHDRYTYGDYRTSEEGERFEIINGQAYASAAPSFRHQQVAFEISRQIGNHLLATNSPCLGASAPIAVILSDEDVVEPDIVVVCNSERIQEDGVHGPPDLVVEILSPSTRKRDMDIKYHLYESYGVAEYWIVSAHERAVSVYLRDDSGRYRLDAAYPGDEVVRSRQVAGLIVDLHTVFPE
jgi:Uma2 family endonuclease